MTLPAAFALLLAASPASAAAPLTDADKANALFERAFQDQVDRSPEFQTALGIKTDQDKWDDRSEAAAAERLSRDLGFLAELKRTVRPEALDPEVRLSYRLFEQTVDRSARNFAFLLDDYAIDQMGGPLTQLVTLLATQHRVGDVADARAYVARLRGIDGVFVQVGERLERQRARGVVPPRWVFPKAAEVGRNVITGAPFDASGADSPLWADFKRKVDALEGVDDTTRSALLGEAKAALLSSVKPAYERLLGQWTTLEASATDDDGVWKLRNGAAYYAHRLANSTTTTLTADAIHEIGLQEVARIQGEMRALLPRVSFKGDLTAFFRFVREDPRFYLPDTPEGREEYLARATAVADDMKKRLDGLFGLKPKADMVVKATEAYREKTASKAFYQRPAPDGTRPGMYYVTLYKMREMPTYQLDAIAYHEGLPGHHMQIAIAQELEGIPRFRRFGFQMVYSEGWGLYCERLPKEIGLYADPYADFGRLAMELWRAVRLVVDTGIHAKRWTRRQAIDYFVANNPLSEDEAVREIERYIMNPGQATSYKIGMMKILELREGAKKELGPRFDLREFHDVVLKDGALPLDVLEEQVAAWMAGKRP